MVDAKFLKEKPITMAELKEEILNIKKRDKELNFRVTQVEEYLNDFLTMDSKELLELKNKLEKLEIPRLREQHICKIVDILPDNIDDLKMLLEGYPITIADKNLKKIVEIVQEFKQKKKI